jgi:phosphoribosyl-dephospho-CoA transferase
MAHDILKVHDLLWISEQSEFFSSEQPSWVRDALQRRSVVVVRRAQAPPGFVSVGIRGDARGQRHAAWLRVCDVQAYRTPESLAAQRGWLNNSMGIASRLLAALALVSEISDKEQIVWGPTGSVGYQLATTFPVTTAASDLDVLLRCRLRPDRTQMKAFDKALRNSPARVDVVLEGPLGGVAINEYLASEEVLIKGSEGPHIAAFNW